MIKASYGEMRSDAEQISNAAGNYKSNVEKLFQEVEQLGDVWKGTDNQEYVTKVSGYKEDMISLGTAVDGYAKFLQASADAINKTQDEVKNLAGRL